MVRFAASLRALVSLVGQKVSSSVCQALEVRSKGFASCISVALTEASRCSHALPNDSKSRVFNSSRTCSLIAWTAPSSTSDSSISLMWTACFRAGFSMLQVSSFRYL